MEKTVIEKKKVNLSKQFDKLSTRKLVLKLMTPVAIQLMLFTLIGVIDSIIVSNYVTDGVSIIGLTDSAVGLFFSFALIISAGLTVNYT
jgi:Na+-driven multidrug efflux pump